MSTPLSKPSDPGMQRWAELLRDYRLRRNLSLDELCDRCGGSPSVHSLSNYERGVNRPQPAQLEKLIAALELGEREASDFRALARGLEPEPPVTDSHTATAIYDVSDLPGASPYPGLASYTYETRELYFGREELANRAMQHISAPGNDSVLFFVTGASGSGKSSFAQAGLLPALESAYTARRRQVRRSVIRPGGHPVSALGLALEDFDVPAPDDGWRALLRAPEDFCRLLDDYTPAHCLNVLIIDQFEELFTQSDVAERDLICAFLSDLAPFGRLRTIIIATLRADYLPSLFTVPLLYERNQRDGIALRAMSAEDLARAITLPTEQRARVLDKEKRVEPALVQRLVEDVHHDPSLLPLLQVTLRTVWDEDPHTLVSERYRFLTDALERKASNLLDADALGRERCADERDEMMSIFLDLVEVSLDDDPRRDVRRTLPKRQLLEGRATPRGRLIDELVDARLLAASTVGHHDTSDVVVEIIHETLLTHWPRLASAMGANRQTLQQRERFRLAFDEWNQHARKDDYLLTGVRLAEARQLDARRDVTLNHTEAQRFLSRSWQVEQGTRRRRTRVAMAIGGVMTVLAVIAAGAAVSLLEQRNVAIEQELLATSRQFAASATAQLSADPELSILLGLEAIKISPTSEADDVLRSALLQSRLRATLVGHQGAVRSAVFSADGHRLLTAGADGTARLWDLDAHQEINQYRGHVGTVYRAIFSPDERSVLTAGDDHTVRLWDAQTGRELSESLGHTSPVTSAIFTDSGNTVISAGSDGLRAWSPNSGRDSGIAGSFDAIGASPDGRSLIAGGTSGKALVATSTRLRNAKY